MVIISACSSSQVETADPQHATERDAHECDVVDVDADTSQLEEGLGSLYDIDNDGYSEADEDAEVVRVGAGEIQLGHHAFSAEDGDRIEAADEYTLSPVGSDERYIVRFFSESGLGVVLYADEGGDPTRLATLDCRGALDVVPEEDVSKMSACNVVWVDEDLNARTLEEGLGSIYDIDDDGFPEADGDATSVDIETTPGERAISIGHHAFAEADGDSIAISEADDHVSYTVRPKGHAEVFSLRIFKHANDAEIPGIGVLLYQKSSSAAPQQLAVLDCRGIEAPTSR